MSYILGTNLKDNKKLLHELLSIRGLGRLASKQILSNFGWNPSLRVKTLTQTQITELIVYINQNYYVTSELHQQILRDIKRKVKMGSYKGIRHIRKLPVRGQRTKTNAKTVAKLKKGDRKSVV